MSLKYDPTANNKPANASSLYLDNAGFKQQQDNINNHESAQKLDTSALSMEKEIYGTGCVGLLIEHWKDVAGTGDKFRDFGTGVLNPTLGKMVFNINVADQENADSIGSRIAEAVDHVAPVTGSFAVTRDYGFNVPPSDVSDVSGNKEIGYALPWLEPGEYRGVNPFDESGSFGGNQKDMGMGTYYDIFGIAGEDEALYKFIRNHEGYENYTDKQIHDLLKEVEGYGCTFVALANTIFDSYKNRQQEFEDKLKFSMIGENGDLNYRFLIMDIILETGFKIFTDDLSGWTPLSNYFYLYPDEMKKLNLYDKNKNLKDNAIEAGRKIIDGEYPMKEMKLHSLLGLPGSEQNRGLHYFKEKNLDMNIVPFSELVREDRNEIQTAEEELKINHDVICSLFCYQLEDIDGNIVYETDDKGNAHEVTIVGETDDKRFIISSHGKKYYLNLSNQKQKFKIYEFYSIYSDPLLFDKNFGMTDPYHSKRITQPENN